MASAETEELEEFEERGDDDEREDSSAVELLSGTPLLTTTAAAPAALASCPPLPGKISTLCTGVPTGMSESGSAHPGSTGEPGPEETTSPGERPAGARI